MVTGYLRHFKVWCAFDCSAAKLMMIIQIVVHSIPAILLACFMIIFRCSLLISPPQMLSGSSGDYYWIAISISCTRLYWWHALSKRFILSFIAPCQPGSAFCCFPPIFYTDYCTSLTSAGRLICRCRHYCRFITSTARARFIADFIYSKKYHFVRLGLPFRRWRCRRLMSWRILLFSTLIFDSASQETRTFDGRLTVSRHFVRQHFYFWYVWLCLISRAVYWALRISLRFSPELPRLAATPELV